MQNVENLFQMLGSVIWLVSAQSESSRAESHHGQSGRGGLIATFVSNASIVPQVPRVLVGIAKAHHTCSLIEASGTFCLHLLSEDNIDLVWRFGLLTGSQIDKFDGLATTPGATGCPRIDGVPAALDCHVESSMDSGDRMIYLAEIAGAAIADPVADGQLHPLTTRRMVQFATPEQLEQLRCLREADAQRDALAIREWRQSRGRD